MGDVRQVDLIRVDVTATDWPSIASDLGQAKPSVEKRRDGQRRVPARLKHLFQPDQVAPQRRLEPLREVAGIDVAGIGDVLAMKLKVVAERGELRDYFDLMAIEQQAGRFVEEGIALFAERYGRSRQPETAEPIVRALGYFDDLDDDLALPVPKSEIASYWERRQPQVIWNLARFRDRS